MEKRRINMMSTEPQARKVLEGMRGKKVAKKSGGMKQGAVTGSSPGGISKTSAQGKAQLERLRQRQADRDLKDIDGRA